MKEVQENQFYGVKTTTTAETPEDIACLRRAFPHIKAGISVVTYRAYENNRAVTEAPRKKK